MEALQRAGRVLSELHLSLDLSFVLEPFITRPPPCALATIATSRQKAVACVCVPECSQQPPTPVLVAQARACAARTRRARAHSRALLMVLAVGLGIIGVALLGCCIERMLTLPLAAADTDGARANRGLKTVPDGTVPIEVHSSGQ